MKKRRVNLNLDEDVVQALKALETCHDERSRNGGGGRQRPGDITNLADALPSIRILTRRP